MPYSSRVKTVIKIISVGALFLPLAALAVPIKISDPIGAGSPLEIYARVIKAFLGTVGIFALLNFVIAGVGLIASRGNPEAVKKNATICSGQSSESRFSSALTLFSPLSLIAWPAPLTSERRES